MQVGTYIEKMFKSELSGNVIGMSSFEEFLIRDMFLKRTCALVFPISGE